VKPGDLVKERRYQPSTRYDYDYDDYDYDECDYEFSDPKKKVTRTRNAIFIKWHIIEGVEKGEFYSCAKVLWSDGSWGNIRRDNIEVISESR
jgi:hypothetical protein